MVSFKMALNLQDRHKVRTPVELLNVGMLELKILRAQLYHKVSSMSYIQDIIAVMYLRTTTTFYNTTM